MRSGQRRQGKTGQRGTCATELLENKAFDGLSGPRLSSSSWGGGVKAGVCIETLFHRKQDSKTKESMSCCHGEVCMLVYRIGKRSADWPLALGYGREMRKTV